MWEPDVAFRGKLGEVSKIALTERLVWNTEPPLRSGAAAQATGSPGGASSGLGIYQGQVSSLETDQVAGPTNNGPGPVGTLGTEGIWNLGAALDPLGFLDPFTGSGPDRPPQHSRNIADDGGQSSARVGGEAIGMDSGHPTAAKDSTPLGVASSISEQRPSSGLVTAADLNAIPAGLTAKAHALSASPGGTGNKASAQATPAGNSGSATPHTVPLTGSNKGGGSGLLLARTGIANLATGSAICSGININTVHATGDIHGSNQNPTDPGDDGLADDESDDEDLVDTEPGAHPCNPSEDSEAPVRYFDGTVKLATTDLSSAGFGTLWGQTRRWTNAKGFPTTGYNGNGIVVTQQPYLVRGNPGSDSQIIVVINATNIRFFNQQQGGSYKSSFFFQEQLTHDTANQPFILTDTTGRRLTFFDFTITPAAQQGQLKQFTDPYGNYAAITYVSNGSDPNWGKMSEVQLTSQSGSLIDDYAYSYLPTTDTNAGLLGSVTLRRPVTGGWTTVRQVNYAYYTNADTNGNVADLKSATIQDGAGRTLDVKYYRYYKSATATGYVDGLKFVFNPQSYARLVAAFGGNPSVVDTLSDNQVRPYANHYFEYDPNSQSVTKEVVAGFGSSANGGLGTFTFSYTGNPANPTPAFNTWDTKTVETLPDGNQHIVYTNGFSEVMLKAFVAAGGSSWIDYYQYDNQGRMIAHADPSAVAGYNDSFADLVDKQQVGDYGWLNANTGRVVGVDYYPNTNSVAPGYFEDSTLRQGWQGTSITQRSQSYIAHVASAGNGGGTTYLVGSVTVYRNTDGTGLETTNYSYTWFNLGAGATNRVQSVTCPPFRNDCHFFPVNR
jgi:hypothetical protein